jgi:hypothetical protein
MVKADDIYYKISPLSLAAIVVLNFLLIYMNLINLENQNLILNEIKHNTEISLKNQELGLNISAQNQEMLQRIINVQERGNETFYRVLELVGENRSSSN